MSELLYLQTEINELRKEIYTEAYSMSIGELANLYKDGELDIHPEFQRLFRWTPFQKTRLIESVMLDIPIPSIFVSQNSETGIWDVVDGVQRLSTFFEFMGILKDEEGDDVKPFVLEKTKYLPSFEGVTWKKENKESGFFNKEMQMDFKRYRIDVKIVKKESDENKKYELFQRLNTGGTRLSDQEVRNCLMVMTKPKIYELFKRLVDNPSFIACTPLSDRKIDEQYRMELITRYIVAKNTDSTNFIKEYSELSDLLDDGIIKICNGDSFNIDAEEQIFEKIFTLLERVLGENSFKAYRNEKFSGAILSSAFLTITIGLAKHIESTDDDAILDKIKKMYTEDGFTSFTGNGIRPVQRFVGLTKFGCEYFENK